MPLTVIAVLAVSEGIEAKARTAADTIGAQKLDVIVADAGVDDVRRHAGARVIVRVAGIQREQQLIDPVQSPGGRLLHLGGSDDPVLLDHGDAGVETKRLQHHIGDFAREAGDQAVVDILRLDPKLQRDCRRINIIPQRDDIPPWDSSIIRFTDQQISGGRLTLRSERLPSIVTGYQSGKSN